jgi:hypothetical protein
MLYAGFGTKTNQSEMNSRMKNRKKYQARQSGFLMKLRAALEAGITVTDEDLSLVMQESAFEYIPVHFYEEVLQLVVVVPRKIILLWPFPPIRKSKYHFCPDRRIRTHRLLGKPALGPSPPGILSSAISLSGS